VIQEDGNLKIFLEQDHAS